MGFSLCVKVKVCKKKDCFFLRFCKGFSFLLPEQKKRNKDELLRTMSEKNSPSALFCLLRHFSPLNKKNSLRSNSFSFLTLQHLPTLHAPKVRPDLSAFTQHRFARWGCGFCFFFCSLRWVFVMQRLEKVFMMKLFCCLCVCFKWK